MIIELARVFVRVLDAFELLALDSVTHDMMVPWTTQFVRVHQAIHVPVEGSTTRCHQVPHATFVVQVHETSEMAIVGGKQARFGIHWASTYTRICEKRQLPLPSSDIGHVNVNRAPNFVVQIIDTTEISVRGGAIHCSCVAYTPILLCPSQRREVPAVSSMCGSPRGSWEAISAQLL